MPFIIHNMKSNKFMAKDSNVGRKIVRQPVAQFRLGKSNCWESTLVFHVAKDLNYCQFSNLEQFPHMTLKDGGHCQTPPQLHQEIAKYLAIVGFFLPYSSHVCAINHPKLSPRCLLLKWSIFINLKQVLQWFVFELKAAILKHVEYHLKLIYLPGLVPLESHMNMHPKFPTTNLMKS